MKKQWRQIRGKHKHRDAIFICEEIEGNRRAEDGEFIAKVYGHAGQDVQKNADLIAATPDLLEELLLALPFIEDAENDPAYDKTLIRGQLKRVRDVINKATQLCNRPLEPEI